MSAIAGSGSITFGDGTTLTSANINLSQVSGAPTALSQFTNNLGNYGGFLDVNSVYQDYTYGTYGYDYHEYGYRWLHWNGSQLSIVVYNCNCVCNC